MSFDINLHEYKNQTVLSKHFFQEKNQMRPESGYVLNEMLGKCLNWADCFKMETQEKNHIDKSTQCIAFKYAIVDDENAMFHLN